MHHFTQGGLRNVLVVNGYDDSSQLGEEVTFQNYEELTKVLGLAISTKPGKITGADFRYLRVALGLTEKSLATLCGSLKKTVLFWEKTGQFPKSAEFFLRGLYISTHGSFSKNASINHVMGVMDGTTKMRIILKWTRGKWVFEFVERA